jgi:molybdopterin-guanine dinucleotide biosynthesis protein B
MRVLGIVGHSGSGKTTLLVRVLPHLRAAGLEVATMKHAHHGFDPLPLDHPAQGWLAAGARAIVLAGPERQLHLHELNAEPEPPADALYPLIGRVDLLLIEGFKHGAHEKLEVYRPENGTPLLAWHDPKVIALASTCGRPPGLPAHWQGPLLDLADTGALVDFIVAYARAKAPATLGERYRGAAQR